MQLKFLLIRLNLPEGHFFGTGNLLLLFLLNVYSFKVLVILFMKHQKILHLTKNASYLATKLNFMKDDCNVDF